MATSRMDSNNPRTSLGREKRVSPRVAARVPVKIICSDLPGALGARSSDIGPGGIGVETPTRFPLDSLQRVIIDLPEGPIQASAEGRWQRENAAGDGHLTGIQFVNLATEVQARLSQLIHSRAIELATFLRDKTDLDLEMDEALDLALFTRLAEFGNGQRIHLQDQQGSRGDSLFLVWSGRVLLEARHQKSQPLVVQRVETGGLFGGLPMMARVPHVTSAITEGQMVALEIDARTFEHFEACKPGVAQRISMALVRSQAAQMKSLVETAIRFRRAA